jgi:hypothetical protein
VAKKLNTGDVIDMMAARFQMVERMGANQSDTVSFELAWRPAGLSRCTAISIPSAFTCWKVTLRCSSLTMRRSGAWSNPERAFCLLAADIVLATNNRFASFLSEAGRSVSPGTAFAPPSPVDIQRLVRVSEAYGYWNAAPAQSAAITG